MLAQHRRVMFRRILIANRGEIACRVIATARRMGIGTVAVYSDADAAARHVALADQAVAIGPALARASYLDGAKIIAAAVASGAEAIHPGYGFLSENADFAAAVAAAGLVFIGPSPAAIRAMGAKHAAKRLMRAAQVPVVPGYDGDAQDEATLLRAAAAIGYPVLVKAALGGGGRGMRRVDAAADLPQALASARREALAAFGDGTLLIEKYLARPRHIEVQVFGDSHGNLVHLFERDCSLQRRHQKVIEEAPAPGLAPEIRDKITDAALRAARAVDYVGAGTVEFIAEADDPQQFYFMEMNTRLQVEHPVTEMVTGIDLVEWQLRVAAGEKLPRRQAEIALCGHAIEARLCAEDPAQDFRPESGRILDWQAPVGPGLRCDSWIETGSEIGIHYDSLLGKLIASGADRAEAIARLGDALRHTRLAGITGNLAFLARAVSHPAFAGGRIDTHFIADHAADLLPPVAIPAIAWAYLALLEEKALIASRADDPSPFAATDRWRVGGAAPIVWHFAGPDGDHAVTLHREGSGWRAAWQGAEIHLADDLPADCHYHAAGAARWLHLGENRYRVQALGAFPRPPARTGPAAGQASRVLAPMPGRIVALPVAPGDAVAEGQVLLRLEAMKMEHALLAPMAGRIAHLGCKAGDLVLEGTLLAEIAP
ncbi:MAG: acetyl-CoA carboxylase biotin carboxylase subunit [Rhodospirillaceae bacterium]|nr:acetyl-CoA carboxylase biotin carboxylase subunit [Rhodospirillaceae bacterium]